jgi:tetratricopeptide (TPR) repeat protein
MKFYILIILVFSLTLFAQETDQEVFLENEDFEQTKEISYNKDDDVVKVENKKDDVFNKESLGHLAEEDLEALKTDDKKENSLDNLIVLCRQKKFDEALEISRTIYPQFVKHPSYWNILGNCYYLKKNFIAAFIYYNKALSFDSKYAPAINNISVMHLKEGKVGTALKKLGLAKDGPVTLFNRAQIRFRYGQINEALSDLNKLKDGTNNKEVNLTLAQLTLITQGPAEAITYFNKLPKGDLFRPDVGLNYSIALFKQGNKSAAEDAFDSTEIPSGKNPYAIYQNNIKNYFYKEN